MLYQNCFAEKNYLNHILVCILVLLDWNGCEAVAESHILPDSFLGHTSAAAIPAALGCFFFVIGCFTGETKMTWKVGRVVVAFILELQGRPTWQQRRFAVWKTAIENTLFAHVGNLWNAAGFFCL